MFVVPFLSNATHLQPLNRFEQTLCHKLQVSVLLCTLKPEFENVALKRPRTEFKYVANFRENCLVLIDRYLGLGTSVIVKALKAQGVTHYNRHFNKRTMEMGGLRLGCV